MLNFTFIKKYLHIFMKKSRENMENVLKILFIFLTLVGIIRVLTLNIMLKKMIYGESVNLKSKNINTNNKKTLIYDRNGESLTTIEKIHFLVLDVLKYKSLEENERKEAFSILKKWNKVISEKSFQIFDEKIFLVRGAFLDFPLEKKKKDIKKIEEHLEQYGHKTLAINVQRTRSFCYKNSFCHILGMDWEGADKMQSIIPFLNKKKDNIKSIQLSIDARIQESISQCLKESVQYYQAQGAWMIGIHLDSREIISLTSYPDFDPTEDGVNLLFSHSNKILTARYEVGSIMKIINIAFYMSEDSGLNLNPNSIIHVPREYKIGTYTITDTAPVGDNPDLSTVFVKSSNKGFASIMQTITGNKYIDFLEKSGFYQQIRVDKIFLEKKRIKVALPRYKILSFSYGYGVAMSPLQMACLFANVFQGEKKDLTLIKNMKFQDPHKQYIAKQRPAHRILPPKIREYLLLMLNRLGQNNPTLYKLGIVSKTGTKLILSGKNYDRQRILAFLVVFYPKEDPKYMFILCVENPTKISTFSNLVTRPIMIKIMEKIKPYLDEESN